MPAPQGWVYRWDALDLNDWTTFMVDSLPEIDNGPAYVPRTVEMADDHPVAVGSDPQSSRWTLNFYAVEPNPGGGANPALVRSDATWQARLAALDAVLTKGAHTLTVKVRGMTTEKSVRVWYESRAVGYRERRISVAMLVPKPVLT